MAELWQNCGGIVAELWQNCGGDEAEMRRQLWRNCGGAARRRTEEEEERLFFIGIGLVDSVNLDRLTHSANWKKTMKI